MVGNKKKQTEFETVVQNNYCTHNPLKLRKTENEKLQKRFLDSSES
jgi:hypothetical protein